MAHILIIGMTESGKSTLGARLAREFRKQGKVTAILDPLNDPRWQRANDHEAESFVTSDKAKFLATVQASRSLAVFVDEAGEAVGQFEPEMHWLATRGRHWGHASHFLSQRGQQIAKTVRDQCSRMYLFTCSKSDAKLLADEWNQEELAHANVLGKGQFFIVGRFEPLRRGQIEFETGRIKILQSGTKIARKEGQSHEPDHSMGDAGGDSELQRRQTNGDR